MQTKQHCATSITIIITDCWTDYGSIRIAQETFVDERKLDTTGSLTAPVISLLVREPKLSAIGGPEEIVQYLRAAVHACAVIVPGNVQFDQHLIHRSFPRGYQIKEWWHGGIFTSFAVNLWTRAVHW
jgi:hypothetical protein